MAMTPRLRKSLQLYIRKLFEAGDALDGTQKVVDLIQMNLTQLEQFATDQIALLNAERDAIIQQLDKNKLIVEAEKI